MFYLKLISVFIAAYVAGGIPFSIPLVWALTGKDIRKLGSGRTGGTNTGRAAGVLAGAVVAILDFSKGLFAVWLADKIIPGVVWAHALAGAFAVWGQIYSIFLWEKREDGRWHVHGGAGGATALGAATGLFSPAIVFVGLSALVVYIFIGYASLTTISIALFSLAIFIFRWVTGVATWQPIIFGLLALEAVIQALAPNLQRLKAGTERMVGLRLYIHNRRELRRQKSLKTRWF
jgi:glycerol-3-phosphate acyltransferase PlsY